MIQELKASMHNLLKIVFAKHFSCINSIQSSASIYKFKKMMLNTSIDEAGADLLAVDLLKSGGVVALPTDTIYGLACSATNIDGINKLYTIKNRNANKPVAICVGRVRDIQNWAEVSHLPNGLLKSLLPGPVTLVLHCINKLDKSLSFDNKVGIRIPNYPFIRNVANGLNCPIALTSANISKEPSSININEFKLLWKKLSGVFDGGVLGVGNSNRGGSTVVDLSEPGQYLIIRDGMACEETVKILQGFHLKSMANM